MGAEMHHWYLSEEFDTPIWVCDLDAAVYSVAHRRMCAWCDELSGDWRWEIVTYEHDGAAASGNCASEREAKNAAEDAARRIASTPGGQP
jgi:hypothetical protein